MEQNNVTQVINNHYPEAPPKRIAFSSPREINKELRDLIEAVRKPATSPSSDVIDFMNELRDRVPRDIYLVPVEYLRFRKDNGRIIAEVESYERETGRTIDEASDEMQEQLRSFLSVNDREKNNELKRLLSQLGQQRPAIATCDGFLVNGNRRKMALEELYRENDQDQKFQMMRVIFLPEGVSEMEIQKVENRYQLQSEGKSEYHVLNKAIKYKRNIESGFLLKAQLRDDPNYHELPAPEFGRVVKSFEKKFINPLACIDRYLVMLGRESMYTTISESMYDKEGRWQAFVQYSNFYYGMSGNSSGTRRTKLNDDEIEKLEGAVFRIIRKRNFYSGSGDNPGGKLGDFIRDLPKYLSIAEAKKEILKIAEIPVEIPQEKIRSANGKRRSEREFDSVWGALYEKEILSSLFLAQQHLYKREMRDKPLELLEDAWKKLSHHNLNVEDLGKENYEKGMELMQVISQKANEIYKAINYARFENIRSGKNN